MILGLDIGTKRIGVALMHEAALLPIPLLTIQVADTDPLAVIKDIISENQVSQVVVGYPRRLNGDISEQTKYTTKFGDKLKNLLTKDTKLSYQDETLTSVLATEELNKKKQSYNKGDIDSLAAVYILEDFAANLRRQSQ